MKKVLLTGASGFIGQHCIPILIASGYEVHAVTSGSLADSNCEARDHILWHQRNLLNDELGIKTLVAQIQPTHLLHLAWCRTVPGKYWNDADNFRWVQCSLTLFREFAKCGGRKIVVAGSCAEYDWSSGLCSELQTPLRPASVYGTCKYSLQLMLHAFAQQEGISASWGRPFFLYGPYEYPERLVASVIQALLQDEAALCTDGHQQRDFLHVEDAATAFVALLESDLDGPVNIASGHAIAVKELVCKIGELLERSDLIKLGALPANPNEPPLLVADVHRLQNMGWQPRFDLENGLKNTIEWWRGKKIVLE